MIKIYIVLYFNYPLFLADFNKIWISQKIFDKIPKYQILWQSVQWEPSCSMRTNRWTDRHDVANSSLLRTNLQIVHFLSVLQLLTICRLDNCLYIYPLYKIYQESYVLSQMTKLEILLKYLYSAGVFKRKKEPTRMAEYF
jgi:hypothetical protein